VIPTNIHVHITNIIITRLDVPVNADDTEEEEEEDDDDASSSSVLELLFLFKKRLKLSLKLLLLFERGVVTRSSDRRSSSSFIVFSLSRRVTNFPENVDTFCAENADVKRKEHARDIHKERGIV
jgi:acyl carrier protein